jgi:hypothetical protein
MFPQLKQAKKRRMQNKKLLSMLRSARRRKPLCNRRLPNGSRLAARMGERIGWILFCLVQYVVFTVGSNHQNKIESLFNTETPSLAIILQYVPILLIGRNPFSNV